MPTYTVSDVKTKQVAKKANRMWEYASLFLVLVLLVAFGFFLLAR